MRAQASQRSKRSLKEIVGIAGAVTHRLDQGYDAPLDWDQTLEAVQHPTTGLNRVELVEVIAYLGAQLVGARNSVDADAALAVAQIESVLRELQSRRGKLATTTPGGAA